MTERENFELEIRVRNQSKIHPGNTVVQLLVIIFSDQEYCSGYIQNVSSKNRIFFTEHLAEAGCFSFIKK